MMTGQTQRVMIIVAGVYVSRIIYDRRYDRGFMINDLNRSECIHFAHDRPICRDASCYST